MRSLMLLVLAVFPLNAFAGDTSSARVTNPRPVAPVCDVAQCPELAAGLDEVDGLNVVHNPAYAWLIEDLHLARLALDEGDQDAALEIADAAHFSLAMQGEHIAEARGEDFVFDLHDALSEVIVACGVEAPPVPELD